MPISFVIAPTPTTGSSNTASITLPAEATTDRLGLLLISGGTGTIGTITGWTLIATQTWWFGGRPTSLFSRVFQSGDVGASATSPLTGTPNWALSLSIWDGADPAAPVEASNKANGSFATTFPTGSVTTTGADRVLVGLWGGSEYLVSLTLPGTMTTRLAFAGSFAAQRISIGSEVASTAGTYSRNATTGSTDDYAGYLVALKPAAGGAAASMPPLITRMHSAILAR